ncbi:MAG: phosphoglycolate phosphatase [Rhodospirillales bacterium CG15_BIG_FIL_POST_REV_8_21_14_020_66_15]|nr:MAG: phosphoglycolate phosphatase [Rhodospirillales bacterium CG15_BIG_FIL_POST_REV_8_21_14_020_66_15]
MTLSSQRIPDAVVFDLDGTLIDSVPDIRAALNWLLARVGRREVSRDEVVGMVGDGVPMLVERGLVATGGIPAGGLEAPIRDFTAHYEANAAHLTRPFPGVTAALQALTDAGCRLGVCTNKPAGATAEILEALALAPFFAAVAGGDTVPGVRKPDPRHLMHVLDALGAVPQEAVMVGDSHNDVNVAKAAGVPTVAVTFGYAHGPVEDLGADALIGHFDELVPALLRLSR